MSLSNNPYLKAEKLSNLQTDKLYFDSLGAYQRILPIPIIYAKAKQKQYNSNFNKTFALRGYKSISRLAAVGQFTDENLNKINKSRLKMARSVEFDA